MHGYHGYVSAQEDLNTGLLGLQITYQRGKMDETTARFHEFPVLLQGMDELKSAFAAVNEIREGRNNTAVDYLGVFSELRQYGNESAWKPQMTALLSLTKFDDASIFQAMNGHVLGNLPLFELAVGDETIWFVYGTASCRQVFVLTKHVIVSYSVQLTNISRPGQRPPFVPHAWPRLHSQR